MTEIKKKRQELGITQMQLAVDVGVSMLTIQLWEKGVSEPKPENMVKLREILGLEG